ncbi:hypothetical protein BLNAU_16193 [Blattamonas nauphoetae]|uniref:Uncharacterized protein n=1 Tax=Blattamonas nauphoetae TaxID=2049346 RepID=A0ABQ9XF65_9EUKA|nr:hypothetical protein BLNAU_16193 [Blattamonas nauphoetae]
MNTITKTTDTSSRAARPDLSSQVTFSMDCSPFLNWNEKELESEDEWAIVFRSLVATLKFQPALAVSLETKAVTFLKSVSPASQSSPDDFLNSLGRATDESPTAFVQSLVVLLSSASQVITTASMELLSNLFWPYSPKLHLSLIKADLIPQIIIALNPHSLSFAETLSIHINLMKTIRWFMWLVTPYPLAELGVQDLNEQQAVRETILQQVVVPSEKYIRHLCVKRFSIVDRQLSEDFMYLLCRLLEISPYYQPTMEVVLNMPVFLTIPSCLTFFEDERTICQIITAATIKMLDFLIYQCSAKVRLALVKADLIPQLINALNPLSLSFTEAADIHMHLMRTIHNSLWLSTQNDLEQLGITDDNEQPAVYETVFLQVVVTSEQYILLLCVNRSLIIDGGLPSGFMLLIAQILKISPSYQPTMGSVLTMPVVLTIPSCLAFFENDFSNWTFLSEMNDAKRKWNKQSGDEPQIWKTVHRMLRMEGIEDVIEVKLQNDRKEFAGTFIVSKSIAWNNQQGMNLPNRCLSLTILTLPLPSASPSPPTPSHSPLPLPHHPHPPTPLCLSLTTLTLPLPSDTPLAPLGSAGAIKVVLTRPDAFKPSTLLFYGNTAFGANSAFISQHHHLDVRSLFAIISGGQLSLSDIAFLINSDRTHPTIVVDDSGTFSLMRGVIISQGHLLTQPFLQSNGTEAFVHASSVTVIIKNYAFGISHA